MKWKTKREGDSERNHALTVYIVLRGFVLTILILSIVRRRWDTAFVCVLTLALFMLPAILERRLKLDLPNALEIIILLFIFCAEILGDLGDFYVKVPHWDTMLHTANGFLMAAIGFAMIDLLNQSPKFHISLSPLFVAFVSFCFSMTIGVLWEFFEYSVDQLTFLDMQKDVIVSSFGSSKLNPDNTTTPIILRDIYSTVIFSLENGEELETVVDGYLDIGLNDTMKDMLVNMVGAIVFSAAGALYIDGRGKRSGRVAEALIPRLLTQEEQEAQRADEKAEIERLIQERQERREKLYEAFSPYIEDASAEDNPGERDNSE